MDVFGGDVIIPLLYKMDVFGGECFFNVPGYIDYWVVSHLVHALNISAYYVSVIATV